MKRWAWVVVALIAAVLGGHRSWQRLQASWTLKAVEIRSNAYLQRGQARPADLLANARALERAAEQDPANVAAWIFQGSQYLLLGRAPKAITLYKQALALEPRAEIHLNLGLAYRLEKNLELAREHFAQAMKLDPRLAEQVPSEFGGRKL